ncbi:MAG: DUF3365 domain-containing protein [Pseudomonadota bacterium]
MKKTTVRTQFYLGAAAILFVFCVAASILEYRILKNQVDLQVSTSASTYLETAVAIRSYAKDKLRPVVTGLIPSQRFVVEAMSTSYVSREIMKKLQESIRGFRYKRSAENPRNPFNLADDFEASIITLFNEHPLTRQWSGEVIKDGHPYYARLVPIVVEDECLKCHGRPSDAPVELRERYGSQASYGYVVGSVVAADTIYVPLGGYNEQIKTKAWWVFTIGFSTLFSLLMLFYLLFNRTVSTRLRALMGLFSTIVGTEPRHAERNPETSGDEIEQLSEAFEEVALHLKTVHDDLKVSELKYRRLFEASPNTMFICNRDMRLININHSGIALFGFEGVDEACSLESVFLLFWDGRDAARIVETIRISGKLWDTEVSMVNRHGKRMDVIFTANRLTDDTGEFAGFEAVVVDITQQKKMNAYLAQTEKLASLGQLAAGVAHEINNPLGVIRCYADLIEGAAPGSHQILDDIRVIKKHTRNCQKVVESLLSFARVSKPDMQSVDIHQCIMEIMSVLNHQIRKSNIELTLDFAPNPIVFTGDPDRIGQVIMNLVLNAIQAMPDGGKFYVGTSIKNGMLSIRFEDTGTGIHKKDLSHIFEPFYTTKKAGVGTGLGLSVSYGIIKQHNGELNVSSTPGKGSLFTVILPVTAQTADTDQERGRTSASQGEDNADTIDC